MYTVLPVVAMLIWASGCLTVPEQLSSGAGRWCPKDTPGFAEAHVGTSSITNLPADSLIWRGFAVLDFRATKDERGRILVVGKLNDVGTATQGVDLQVMLPDEADHVVAVSSFCPAAYHSIAPNHTRPLAYSFGREDRGVRAELRSIRIFYTMGTLGLATLTR